MASSQRESRAHAPADSQASARQPLGRASSKASLLSLGSTVGNQAVQRLLGAGVIQRLSVDDYRGLMKNGNFSLGSATREVANKIGADWVGYKPTNAISVSDDGLHQYRKASWKPNRNAYQANVEGRDKASGAWPSNGHITITDGET